MANFEKAYSVTMANEGGYSNDPDDYGKETYKGISRKFFPSWRGWKYVDTYKTKPNFPSNMKNDIELEKAVRDFYKHEFWDVHGLDNVASQIIADELFDTGVNLGVKKAALFLQMSLNTLNRQGNLYSNIPEDGNIGSGTLSTLNTCIKQRGEDVIFKLMNILQGIHYYNLMRKDETQEKFACGWLERVTFTKK